MPVLGVVGAVLGAVVGRVVGAVVGAVVGRGAGAVLGTVVVSGVLLRQPVSAQRVRTAAMAMQRIFFILKPPEITDFTAIISKETTFTLEKTARTEKNAENFIKNKFSHCYFEISLV